MLFTGSNGFKWPCLPPSFRYFWGFIKIHLGQCIPSSNLTPRFLHTLTIILMLKVKEFWEKVRRLITVSCKEAFWHVALWSGQWTINYCYITSICCGLLTRLLISDMREMLFTTLTQDSRGFLCKLCKYSMIMSLDIVTCVGAHLSPASSQYLTNIMQINYLHYLISS